MKIGYARVSTEEQSFDLQLDALRKAGCKKIYQETVSGAKAARLQLDLMLDNLRAGDVLVIMNFRDRYLIAREAALRLAELKAEPKANYSKFTGSTSRNIIYLAFSMDYGSRGKIMEFTRNIST